MVWANFDPKAFTQPEFGALVAKLQWNAWAPAGIVLHNTSAPTLAQWAESGPNHDARLRNLQSYYEGLGWHAGPHLFVSRDYINTFANILLPGVHSRCYNSTHLGVEMVGDYDTEEFESGDGALVRANAVFAVATLFRAIGVTPTLETLRFHRECLVDNHACPGKKVDKQAFLDRVLKVTGASPKPAPPPAKPVAHDASWVQARLNALGASPPLVVDGALGPASIRAIAAFLDSHTN